VTIAPKAAFCFSRVNGIPGKSTFLYRQLYWNDGEVDAGKFLKIQPELLIAVSAQN
jgi:hypothetical protein